MKADRFNEGKPIWTLVHFGSLVPLVRVMEYGMKKYTKKVCLNEENFVSLLQNNQEWQIKFVLDVVSIKVYSQEDIAQLATLKTINQKLNAQNVEKSEELKQKICALLVTNLKESTAVKKKQIELDNIKNNTDLLQLLKRKSVLGTSKEVKILAIKKNVKEQNSCEESQNMDYQKMNILNLQKEDVQFVDQNKDHTLIMTMKREDSEIYYVVNAITPSDCLMMMYNFWKKQLNTLPDIKDNEFILSGRENWKKGLDKKEVLDSLTRHLTALIDGEEHDPESQVHHIGHIMANCMFYSYHHVDPKTVIKETNEDK